MANGAWTRYHFDDGHTGLDPTALPAVGANPGWVSPTLDGQVYGEPLIFNGLVYVATLQNTVYAINQATGALVWAKNLGAPKTSGWQCGNVNPTGILSTGVIDTMASRIYEVPFLSASGDYWLYALDLATGNVVMHTDLSIANFDWTIQQQRGALALSVDRSHVYVPFGGRAGDCGPYHGWVTGVPVNGTPIDELYVTPSTASGVWDAGGPVVDDSTGNVFFSTGNAIPCIGSTNSDSVIGTNSTLHSPTFFQPQDWYQDWCRFDVDLGSASPVLISPNLMFMSGKFGQGFLLNPKNLGSLDGQLFPTPKPATYSGIDVCHGIHSDATFGSFAYAAPYMYLECDGGGMVGLKVDTAAPSFSPCRSGCASPSWNAGGGTTFGPPIVAGGVVWAVDINGGGLSGFDGATGSQIYQSAGFGVNHFSTPSEAGNQIFVSAGTEVRSFNVLTGCRSVSVGVSPSSPSAVGTTITVTAAATGCPDPNPVYRFALLAPGAARYQQAQAYSTSPTYIWNTAGLALGTYRFSVWVRDANSAGAFGNSDGTWDAYNNNTTYTLSACSSVNVSASPPSRSGVGTPVTVIAAGSGCPDPNPAYRFAILAPGAASYQLAQAYSTSPTFSWSTAGLVPGTYRFSIWVRDASSSGAFGNSDGRWDAYNNNTTYSLSSCSALSVSTSPGSSAGVGMTVTVSARATGCPNPNPLYRFSILAPGASSYQLAQGYSTSSSYIWTTTGLVPGVYRFSVWAKDASSAGATGNSSGTWDTYNNNATYSLSSCSAIAVMVSPASPTGVGATVKLTATAFGCPNPNPLYQFSLLAPGSGTYVVAQPYSISSTFSWNTTGLATGQYRISVWAKDTLSGGSTGNGTGRWDSYNNNTTYALN